MIILDLAHREGEVDLGLLANRNPSAPHQKYEK
jgi:hypothetical protein